jgi:hypothetical protein
MNAMNHITDELFNLIETKPWLALQETEKELVLKLITQEEYQQLHKMFAATTKLNEINDDIMVSPAVKKNLDKAFDAHHQKAIMIPLWHAAAVFLIVFGGFLFYFLNQSSMENTIANTIHDTLYVPQIVERTEKITDTVMVYKYITIGKKQNAQTTISNHTIDIPVAQIRTLSPEEIKNSTRNYKNKSMQEDTLFKKIGYASI